MSLRILVLSFYYPPDLGAGSFRCVSLVEQLSKRLKAEDNIEVITTKPNRYATYQVEVKNKDCQKNLSIYRVTIPYHRSGMIDQGKAFISYAKGALKLVRGKKFDLIFATSSRLMTGVLGAYIAKKLKVPLYLDVRDLFVDTINDVLPKKMVFFLKPIFKYLEHWSFKEAKYINLISKGFESYFIHNYPNIIVRNFTHGVDDEFIDAFSSYEGSNLNKPLTVLYAGNVGEGQGLHIIIPKLAKALESQVTFIIVGAGGRYDELKGALQKENCKNVQLILPVDRCDLIKMYQNADLLFLHLNDYAAFKRVLPSKIFEYAASGKPIWAGVDGFAAKFIQEEIKNSYIFNPCNANAAIEKFLSIKLDYTNRKDFVNKYTRTTIMGSMVEDMHNILLDSCT